MARALSIGHGILTMWANSGAVEESVRSSERFGGVRVGFQGVGSTVGGGDFPGGSVGKQTANQLRVQRVAGFACFHAAHERKPNKGQVADKVESFVAAELVREAKRPVHDAVFGEHNGVIERSAADQAHGA